MMDQVEKIPIKPVGEYLVNGPIPADELMDLEFLESYLESGIVDTTLDIHFMLEHVSVHGAPEWWKGTIPEFEQEFHERYHRNAYLKELDSEFIWRAAYAEVESGRLSPIPEEATKEQIKEFLSYGKKRADQTWAVELLLDMWVEAK